VALALLLLLTAMAIWRRNEAHLLVGWSWFLGTLVPMIGIVQVGEQATADRFAYIPTIGLFLLLVWLMAETRRGQAHPPSVGINSCLLLGLGLLTYRQLAH